MYDGSLVTYNGRNTIKDLQIQSFDCDYDKNNWGGLDFTMELKVVRIANPSYKKKTTTATSTIKVGGLVIFKGGNVYKSSTATKASAKRGRSTCKVTKISSKAKHPYHLVSTDGKKVYGWVDKSLVQGVASQPKLTTSKTNAGTQQTKTGTSKAVYHTTKKGDTVYSLVNKTYKSLGTSESWVIKNNPNAFSKKGDPKTLKVGVKLLMGYKS